MHKVTFIVVRSQDRGDLVEILRKNACPYSLLFKLYDIICFQLLRLPGQLKLKFPLLEISQLQKYYIPSAWYKRFTGIPMTILNECLKLKRIYEY